MEHTYLLVVSFMALLGLSTSGLGLVVAMDHAWVRRQAEVPGRRSR